MIYDLLLADRAKTNNRPRKRTMQTSNTYNYVIDSAELSIAMMKTSEYMLFKLYNNMSLKRGFVVKEMIEYHQVIIKEDKILKNQKKLEVIIIKLKDCGEIKILKSNSLQSYPNN